ncbi:MAG: MGMT family protein [Kouleothrix sp.]
MPATFEPPNYALYDKIYAVVEQIPPGRVATYGDIATIVGGGCDARTVGFALNEMPAERAQTLAARDQPPGRHQHTRPGAAPALEDGRRLRCAGSRDRMARFRWVVERRVGHRAWLQPAAAARRRRAAEFVLGCRSQTMAARLPQTQTA